MPRRARLVLPHQPLHVTQRGVNRAAIFFDDEDRHHYRRLLRKSCAEHDVAVHAFVLMDNHVHLLLTPGSAASLARAMRISGQCYVQAFNARHRRSGTLWQSRFHSCLIDTDRYLLTVCRYIELNPVRAGMVDRPEDYRWSSVHTHLGTACDPLIMPHPLYLALGSSSAARVSAYRRWLNAGIDPHELADIRRYIAQQRALGDGGFQAMVEKTLNHTAVYRSGGRPKAGVAG